MHKSLFLLFLFFTTSSFLTAAPQENNSKNLTRNEAKKITRSFFLKRLEKLKQERKSEWNKKAITLNGKTLRYKFRILGREPRGGHSLYISLHGGGNAPADVNDHQWNNQIKLYTPKEGIYVAPRAPTNTWNLWHEAHIDPLFDRLIEDFIVMKGINPNKVYILGYSAGGDGLYQLAPRMADRWAAAAMMAGHPGDAQTYNLLNLPFFIQCGGKDAAYHRNVLCKKWGKKLDALAKENPGYYPHRWIVYPKFGHWMNRKDRVAIPWMAKKTRNPWPKKINWYQDNVTHSRFYWLAQKTPQAKQFISAEVKNQTITLSLTPSESTIDETPNFTPITSITLRLSDKLLNLDKPVIVKNGEGKVLFQGKVPRGTSDIEQSLNERLDPSSVSTAHITINF